MSQQAQRRGRLDIAILTSQHETRSAARAAVPGPAHLVHDQVTAAPCPNRLSRLSVRRAARHLQPPDWRVTDAPFIIVSCGARRAAEARRCGRRCGGGWDSGHGGSGSANCGNTARRALRLSAEFAARTGVDGRLIRDLYVILQAISCFYMLDSPPSAISVRARPGDVWSSMGGFSCP